MSTEELWRFLPIGYLITILIEAPILFLGLPRCFPRWQRIVAGVWLTACTYPIVVLALPLLMAEAPRAQYLLVAEVFAPLAECVLFRLAFGHREGIGALAFRRSYAVIVVANLASFGLGEIVNAYGWLG